MAGKPIPITTANDMTRLYGDYTRDLPVPSPKKTQSISFTLPEIMEWLAEIAPYSDELRICMGVYPDSSTHPGRVTAIIWPYKNGQPATRPLIEGKDGGDEDEGVPPYNDGSNSP